MKKLALLGVVLFFAGICFAVHAKWTKQESWRRIEDGMPMPAVVKLLGEPAFFRRSNTHLTYFYGTKEPDLSNQKQETLFNSDGHIKFILSKQNKKLFVVSKIYEPDFSKVENIEAEKPKKLKPKHKLEKWQIEKSWLRLKEGMTDKAVINILGEPTSREDKDSGYNYIYGEGGAKDGYVAVRQIHGDDYVVTSWREPFWYFIEKEHYEKVTKEEDNKTGNN